MTEKEVKREKERRRSKRVRKALYVQCHVYDTDTPWASAIVQDISEAGISISTTKEFSIDATLEIKVSTFMRTQPVSVVGKVLSCEKKPAPKNWITRISIEQINEEDKAIFQEFIQLFLKTKKVLSQNNSQTGERTEREASKADDKEVIK